MRRLLRMGCLAGLVIFMGCASTKTTNTARTAQEQLLISNSMDQALDKVDFSAFDGEKVFIDDKYLECVDKQYLLGSVRHRALRSGARVVEKTDEADIIVELRSGGVGTNSTDMFVGSPEFAMPGPLPIALPEVRLLSKQTQAGIAKIGIVAYDAKTRQMLGDGGMTMAQSDDNNWYVLGMGPYQKGSVRHEIADGVNTTPPVKREPLPYNVAFDEPRHKTPGQPEFPAQPGVPPSPGPDRVEWAGSMEDGGATLFPVHPASK